MPTTSTPVAPDRSQAQREEALVRANYIRSWRAAFKRDLFEDRIPEPHELLLEWPPELDTMRILVFLEALPGIGTVKARTLLRRAEISPVKTIGGLSRRQRSTVYHAVRGHVVNRRARRAYLDARDAA